MIVLKQAYVTDWLWPGWLWDRQPYIRYDSCNANLWPDKISMRAAEFDWDASLDHIGIISICGARPDSDGPRLTAAGRSSSLGAGDFPNDSDDGCDSCMVV